MSLLTHASGWLDPDAERIGVLPGQAGQSASGAAAHVDNHLATAHTRIVNYIISQSIGDVGEYGAYGDGASSYASRALAITAAGDSGTYT